MPGPSVGTALWRNWREYRHSRAAETFEVSLYSDADVIGWVQRPGWPVDLIPAMTDPAYPGLRFALVARIRWCPEPTPVPACFARPAARGRAASRLWGFWSARALPAPWTLSLPALMQVRADG